MRIETSMTALPVEGLHSIGQTNGVTPFRRQFDAFQKELSDTEQAEAKSIEQSVRALNKAAEAYDIALQFSRDDETGAIVIKMVKQETGEVVHQIPEEAKLHLSAVLGKLQGQLFARAA